MTTEQSKKILEQFIKERNIALEVIYAQKIHGEEDREARSMICSLIRGEIARAGAELRFLEHHQEKNKKAVK